MVSTVNIRRVGSSLVESFSDGSVRWWKKVNGDLWLPTRYTAGGSGGSTGGTGSANIYNPWTAYPITGTWADHMTYSAGGIDYPLPYGTGIRAPASGTLHTSGGSGEYQAGQVGSAGRRSILYLDTDFPRIVSALETSEGTGPMHAIVFQHQSEFGTDGQHYAKGAVCGVSGASANGSDYGGDVHLHVHGLTTGGARVDFLNFIP